MRLAKLFVPAFLFIFLSSCYTFFQSGYIKENGNWIYVTYDEGAGKRIENLNIDNETFTVLQNKQYAKDKNNVFYKGDIIKDASPNTFEVINNEGYSKDENYVYVDLYKVIDADPRTFIYLGFPYSRDHKSIYCGTLPMPVNSLEDFKVTENGNNRITELTSSFIESNRNYSFIDIQKYEVVVYGYGRGVTKEQKFIGYKLEK